ncbi:hypothetical protein CC2G_009820 [Coprinopsis cinerea AmutBmut pab1-1]|nr:hypothetical protein CC2G_009820 [Coprinopsis cinerea AmutBmut pab1-1]
MSTRRSKWVELFDASWKGHRTGTVFHAVRRSFKMMIGAIWIGLVILTLSIGAVDAKQRTTSSINQQVAIAAIVSASVWIVAFFYTHIRRANPMLSLYPASSLLWLPPIIILLANTGGDKSRIKEEELEFLFVALLISWIIAPFSLIFWPIFTAIEETFEKPTIHIGDPTCGPRHSYYSPWD